VELVLVDNGYLKNLPPIGRQSRELQIHPHFVIGDKLHRQMFHAGFSKGIGNGRQFPLVYIDLDGATARPIAYDYFTEDIGITIFWVDDYVGIIHKRCLGERRSNEVRLPEKQPRKEQPANHPPDKRSDDKPTHQRSVKKSHRSKNLFSKVDRQQYQKEEAHWEKYPDQQSEFQDNFKARQKAEDFEEVEHGIGMRYIV